jgi:hypothetical protein
LLILLGGAQRGAYLSLVAAAKGEGYKMQEIGIKGGGGLDSLKTTFRGFFW